MPKNIETEFKWGVCRARDFDVFINALKQLSVLTSDKKIVTITDYYLDNRQRQFTKNKVALRVRCIGNIFQATLKTRTALKNGLARRQELTRPLPPAATRQKAIYALQAYQEWAGYSLANLHPYFVIKNKRTVYDIHYKNCRCEAALDNYLTQASGHQMRRREIELELKSGRVADFKKLVQQISLISGLSAAKISKVAGAEKWIKQKFRRD